MFEPNKTATELGIDVNRKFRVIVSVCEPFKRGDVVKLYLDDNTSNPCFYFAETGKVDSSRRAASCSWSYLEYADEQFEKITLKVGDRIKGIYNAGGTYTGTVFDIEGDIATIKRDDGKIGRGKNIPGYGCGWDINKGHANGEWGAEGYCGRIEIINQLNNKTMNIKEKFVQAFLKEPEKTFRKLEITNGDGILTEDGQKVFLGWLLNKYGTDFKTEVCDGLLEEEKTK